MSKPRYNLKHNNIIKGVQEHEAEFKRPDHPDFMLSSELKAAEFTGVRQNEISREWEFWIVGEIKARVPETEATPQKLHDTHLELFAMRNEGFANGPQRT